MISNHNYNLDMINSGYYINGLSRSIDIATPRILLAFEMIATIWWLGIIGHLAICILCYFLQISYLE